MGNRTCTSAEQEEETVAHVPLFSGSSITFHQLGLIISATFGAIAVAIAFFLIWSHASHCSKPHEQKYIIRILVMIPIYAVVSFLSYVWYHNAVYFEVARDCYEAFAIASFFTLMCHYIAPNLHEQKQFFRSIEPRNWVWPFPWLQKCTGGKEKGWLRRPHSGLTWFNIIWVGVFQYCFIRPFFTLVAVITQANDVYCQSSLNPGFAYIWVAGFEALSVTIAMYCLIQFYVQLKNDLAPHRPFLKVLCIKLVIFFCFWQSWIISLLTASGGPIQPTDKIAGPDLRIGLPSMLVCFEMSIFAIMHIFAFPWKPYDLGKQKILPSDSGAEPRGYVYGPFRAIASAMNPWDIIKAFGRAMRWLFVGARRRKQDVSYQTKLATVSSDTGYVPGPTFAGNGEAATETTGPTGGLPGGRREGTEDSDTVGLLSSVHANPYARMNTSQVDVYSSNPHGNPDTLPTAPTPGQEYGMTSPAQGRRPEFEYQDTTYDGHDHNAAARPYQDADHGRPSTEWDMFAGANRPGQRPPGGAV